MSFPAPLIKSFHYSGHDRARTATRESSDFSFISVPVKCPETSSQLLDHRRKKSPKNYKKPKIKGGGGGGSFSPEIRTTFARQVFQKKKPSGLSVN